MPAPLGPSSATFCPSRPRSRCPGAPAPGRRRRAGPRPRAGSCRRPEVRLDHAGSSCTSAARPRRSSCPRSRTTTWSQRPMTIPMLCSTRSTVRSRSSRSARIRSASSLDLGVVEAAGRLVEHQQLRALEQSARQLHALERPVRKARSPGGRPPAPSRRRSSTSSASPRSWSSVAAPHAAAERCQEAGALRPWPPSITFSRTLSEREQAEVLEACGRSRAPRSRAGRGRAGRARRTRFALTRGCRGG